MLEAKDQGHKRKCSPKKKKRLHKNFSGDLKKKKRSSQTFFKRSPLKNVFQKIFQALHKILTFQKILLSSSRGQANFRGLEASRPRPRTSKCVLEDSTSDAQGQRKRLFVKCLICEEFEFEAKKYSRNGVVPLARGCRADSKKKLMDVVDHLLSQPHKKSSDYKQLNRQWKSQSTSHPWIYYLTKQRVETVEMLIRLSIDVYNDSLLLTPTAFSWPGRSLASLHSDQLISSFRENGFDQQFEEFKPPGSVLLYRDPVIYAEMLKIEGELQSKVTSNLVNAAVVWAVQVVAV